MLKALPVYAVEPLGFSKAFSPATVDPGEVSRLTYTIDNLSNTINVGSLTFRDSLPFGVSGRRLVSNSCGGSVSAPAGDSGRVSSGGFGSLSLSGGAVAAGRTCRVSFEVEAIAAGARLFTSGDLTSDLPVATPGASATLTVNEVPLSVSMAFEPATIDQGGISRLSYRLNNGALSRANTVTLSDTLPEDVVVADTPNLMRTSTCGGGSVQAPAGGRSITWFSGRLAAGATCTIAVDVTSAADGSYSNDTERATSSLGTSTAASATLTVEPAEAPGFARVFSPDTIRQGGETQIVFTVDNGANAIAMTEMAFDDSLPSGVSVADTPGTANGCGGTFNPVAGATTLAFTGGVLAAGATCELRVTVRAIEARTLTGPAVDLTSNIATASAAEATLTVDAVDALGFAKAFSPATVDPGGMSRLTFTIDNGANAFEVGSLAFTDAFPDGLAVAGTPDASTTCGGTFAPAASATSLAFSGGRVAARQTCTISVDVLALAAGALTGLSSELTSDLPVATSGASAALTVNAAPLSVSMSFVPPTIGQGGVSRLTYGLDNGAAVAAASVSLSDSLPAGVVLADLPDAQTTCAGGTLTAAAGGSEVSYSGGTLGAGATCTIAVDVTSVAVGSHPNDMASATSSLGDSTPAEATLTIDPAAAPDFARVFSPDTIGQGGETEIVFTVDNGANAIAMTGMAFDASLPSGVSVADTPGTGNSCGGTFNPVAGAMTLGFADGVLAAGATCELRVTVRAIEAGTLTGPAVALTSSVATARAAEATLTVDPAVAPVFSKAFSPATVDPGGVSTLTYRIDNAANLIDVGRLAFTDAFPDGLTVAGTPNGSTTCGGTFAPAASATSLAFSGGRVGAGQTCTISVDVLALRSGALTSTSGDLTSDLPVATSGASAMLTVNEVPLSVSIAFEPATIDQGRVSRLTYDLNNGAAVEATSVDLSDTLPADVVLADPPDARTTCTGGTLTAGGGDVSYSGGSLGAGAACAITVDVISVAVGSHSNDMASVTSSLGASPPAEATLTVDAAEAPGFSKAFSPARVALDGTSRLTYTIDNSANAIAMTEMAFADSLPPGVSVADTPGTANSCGGAFSPVAGATTLSFADGVLAAGATCELRVTVRATGAGTLTGPAVALTSSIATASAAEATLTVEPAEAPGFAKAFSPATVDPGGISTLTFRIDNTANLIDVGGLAFDDDFPDGLAVAPEPNTDNSCGGTLSAPTGGTTLSLSGGDVAAGATCTLSVDVQALQVGTLTGTSGELTSDLPVATPGVAATLTVNEVPLSVSMAFEPTAIRAGGVSRLTYELGNDTALAAASVSLSDTLPADVVLADPPDAQTTCAGGTLTAAAGGSEVSYSGGTLGAGGTCTIAVDVTSPAAGSHPNDMANVTSSLGDSTPAEATLTVDAADAPGFARVFSPATIPQGGETQIVFMIDNGANAIAMTGMAFADSLPPGVSVADTPGVVNGCGGTFNPVAGATTLTFTGRVLAAGATCELRVTVRAIEAGTLTYPEVVLTSSIATATAAEATLTVEPAEAPVFSKTFSPATVDPGGVSRLTFTIDNAANLIDVGSLAFEDDFPDGLAVADPPNGSTICGGTFAPAASATSLAFTGGRVAAGQTCTISVDVLASRAGALTGTSSDLTSDLPVDAPGASATLTVREAPLSVSMSFAPSMIDQGRVSRLTYGLDNGAAVAAASVSLSDTLPAGVVLADPPDAQTTCAGGTLTAAAGGSEVSYSGGTLGAGATCTIAVDVTSTTAGSHRNSTETVTSSLGASPPAEATLTVDAAAAPGFARVFSPDTIPQGGETEIVFTVDNGANAIAMTGMAFDDSLPSGVSVADTPGAVNGCGGTFSPVAGDTTLGFADGVLAAGATCELRVTVRALEAGTLTGREVVLTSSIAMATAPEATLTVGAAEVLHFAKAFSPDTIDPGEVSTLTFTIDNTANLIDVGGLAFTDAFPDGLAVAGTPNGSTTCGGTFAPAVSATSLAFTGGRVAAGQTCTISVDVLASRAGDLTGTSGDLTSDLPVDAPGVPATLTVREAPLSVSMSFVPAAIGQGRVSRLTYGLDNGASVAAASVSLFDSLPAGVVLADPPDAQTTCAGGTLTAATGGSEVSYSGGTLGAGATCTIAVDVTSVAVGSHPNDMASATSSLGDSTPAEATLTVDAAAAPGFARVFSPATIPQGGETQIVFTVDNGANAIAMTGMAFDASLPSGVSVADTPGTGNSCGGTFNPVAGATTLGFADGVLAAGATCELRVTVRAIEAGTLTGPAVALTSSIATARAAEATLTVDPAVAPVFSKAFSPATVDPGGVSTLTYRIDNAANLIDVGGLAFTDAFPDGLAVAGTPNGSTTCGGTFAPAVSATSLAFSGGRVGAGQTCTISVDVLASRSGALTSTSGDLISDLPVATSGASATLTVNEVPLSVSIAFEPATIDQGRVSRLTYDLNNGGRRSRRRRSTCPTRCPPMSCWPILPMRGRPAPAAR